MNPIAHVEIPVSDLRRAMHFYQSVFGIAFTDSAEIHGNRMAFFPFSEGEDGASGALAQGEVYVPTQDGAIVYLRVDSIADVIARARQLGSEVLFPETSIGEQGSVAEISDSEGNRIALQSPPAQSGPDIAPVITDRLRLRPFAREDRAAWADWNSRPDVYRFLHRHAPQGDALATRFQSILNAGHRFHQDGDELRLAVERRGDQALIGEVVLKLTSQSARQAEVGYIFSPNVIGQGYATEAVRAMISFGFAAFGFQRIFARLDAGNIGSVGVLERLGLRREAHLLQSSYFDGNWSDEYIYAILHREWSAGE